MSKVVDWHVPLLTLFIVLFSLGVNVLFLFSPLLLFLFLRRTRVKEQRLPMMLMLIAINPVLVKKEKVRKINSNEAKKHEN